MIFIQNFRDDGLWKEAKNYAQYESQPDNWILVIDFYTSYKGKHAQVFCEIESLGVVRIIGVTDCNMPILLDKQDNVHVHPDYDEVYESRKSFYFQPSPHEMEIELPRVEGSQYTYLGEKVLATFK